MKSPAFCSSSKRTCRGNFKGLQLIAALIIIIIVFKSANVCLRTLIMFLQSTNSTAFLLNEATLKCPVFWSSPKKTDVAARAMCVSPSSSHHQKQESRRRSMPPLHQRSPALLDPYFIQSAGVLFNNPRNSFQVPLSMKTGFCFFLSLQQRLLFWEFMEIWHTEFDAQYFHLRLKPGYSTERSLALDLPRQSTMLREYALSFPEYGVGPMEKHKYLNSIIAWLSLLT